MTLLRTERQQGQPPFGDNRTDDMVWIPGGTFRMGSDRHYPEEAPVHRVTVDGFWIDRTPVTNRQFKQFVKATGHVTFAEIAPDPKDYPGALPHMLYAGSLVFTPPHATCRSARLEPVVDLHEGRRLAASLRAEEQHQRARRSSGRARSLMRMRWPMRDGPARTCRPKRNGSSPRAAASTAPSSPGATSSRPAASIWPTPGRANFPLQNLHEDGYERTSPVTAFPPNGYGVHDMIGNVWEWTADWYSPEARGRRAEGLLHSGKSARRPRGRQLRPLPAQHQNPAQGPQGRLASVRAELLPPLPPGRAPCRSRSIRRPAISDFAA